MSVREQVLEASDAADAAACALADALERRDALLREAAKAGLVDMLRLNRLRSRAAVGRGLNAAGLQDLKATERCPAALRQTFWELDDGMLRPEQETAA